ncbi:hypothetical protein [Haloferula sargassicola]|uniref:Uncharacterized protein n=1 Tax=Haloferula sargassicola TaxID=490096 RepID=A0ABP9UL45_9BACT
MALSFEQIKRYRASWAPVAKAYRELGGFSTEEIEEERLAILRTVMGKPEGKVSSKDLTDRQFTKVLGEHRKAAVLILGPGKIEDEDAVSRRRIIFRIDELGLPDTYLNEIATDAFGSSDWRTLPRPALLRLLWTAKKRAKAHSEAR